MKKAFTLLALTFFALPASMAQTLQTQSRNSAKIMVWKPAMWANTVWQNVQYDDNTYIKSQNKIGNLGAIMFFNLGFAIPAGATIQKIDASIIRFKNGRNAVTEQSLVLMKQSNETEACIGTNAPNLASKDPWTEVEKLMLYSFSAQSADCNNQPFKWTPEEVNKPMFGLMLHPYISISGKGSSVFIEQVKVTVYYTEATVTKTQTAPRIYLQQRGKTVVVNASTAGKYMLTVTDNFGRSIQQTALRTGQNETIQLNAACKGYCIISVL